MPIITRFGGSGGGTPVVDPYPHVWECTVVQSGTTGVVSGVVTLETYDILHYTMPLGFSTYDLMIGGVTYHTSFRNEGEMYIQWDGNDFSVVSANASCGLSHVWTSPTYTITGSVLTITGGVDDLHTNDVIELTLASGESASVIEYDSNTYTINNAISTGVNYIMFNGASFENGLFNFLGDAISSDVRSGKTFYSNNGTLLTGSATIGGSLMDRIDSVYNYTGSITGGSSIAQTVTVPIPATYQNSNSIYFVEIISISKSSTGTFSYVVQNVTDDGTNVSFYFTSSGNSGTYTYTYQVQFIKFKGTPTITKYYSNMPTSSLGSMNLYAIGSYYEIIQKPYSYNKSTNTYTLSVSTRDLSTEATEHRFFTLSSTYESIDLQYLAANSNACRAYQEFKIEF